MAKKESNNRARSLLWSFVALALCVFIWPALLTFSPGDWPSPNQFPHNAPAANACGVVGAWFAYQLRYFLGDGSFPLLLFLTLASSMRLVRGRVNHLPERIFGIALLAGCTAASAHLISQPGTGALPVGHGGVVGYALGDLLRTNLDRLGTLIVLVSCLIVGLLFATEGWVLKLPGIVRQIGETSGGLVAMLRALVAAVAAPRSVPAGHGVTTDERGALMNPRRIKPRGSMLVE